MPSRPSGGAPLLHSHSALCCLTNRPGTSFRFGSFCDSPLPENNFSAVPACWAGSCPSPLYTFYLSPLCLTCMSVLAGWLRWHFDSDFQIPVIYVRTFQQWVRGLDARFYDYFLVTVVAFVLGVLLGLMSSGPKNAVSVSAWSDPPQPLYPPPPPPRPQGQPPTSFACRCGARPLRSARFMSNQ